MLIYRLIILLIFSCGLTESLAEESSPPVYKNEKWQKEFKLNQEPNKQSENWRLHRWGGAQSVLAKGWLRVASFSVVHGESAGAIWKYYDKQKGDKTWDGSKPTTVEFRVEISTRTGVAHGASIVLADGVSYYPVALPAAGMTTYRISLDKGKARLYRAWDGVLLKEINGIQFEGDDEIRNFIYFGDPGEGVDGASIWEFIRWTHDGAYPSVGSTKIKNFGYERPLDFTMFPDDARQWNNHRHSLWFTDLSEVQPSSRLTQAQREKGKWKVLPFKTDEFSGYMLSAYQRTGAATVELPLLGAEGRYAIYLGLSTAPLFHNSERGGVRVKLTKEADFRNLFNELDWLDHKRDVIQEVFYTVAELNGTDTLQLAQIPNLPAAPAYVRLVPVDDSEYEAYLFDRDNPAFKTNIGTIDGHGILLYNAARTASDIRGHYRMFENSDYGKWWFQVLGADLVNYPSKIGTLAGVGNTDFPRWYDDEFVASLEELIANNVNALTVSREKAKETGTEFHVMVRAQGWASPIPFEETFNSKFYIQNPQWRCVDEYGIPAMYMSYAVPEVRQRLKDIIKETVQLSDPDGVGILFNRGMPLMLWEQAFADAFYKKYQEKLKDVPFDDKRIQIVRAEIMTNFMRELRAMLDSLGEENSGKRYKVSLAVLDQTQNNRHGIAIDQWLEEGLVDEIAVPPGEIGHYVEAQSAFDTKIYPLILPWDNYAKPLDFAKRILSLYEKGSSGIGIWDGDVEFYKKTSEPHLNHIIRYIGHRDLMKYWNDTVMPRPNTFRITQMGENHYSGWLPNSGF